MAPSASARPQPESHRERGAGNGEGGGAEVLVKECEYPQYYLNKPSEI